MLPARVALLALLLALLTASSAVAAPSPPVLRSVAPATSAEAGGSLAVRVVVHGPRSGRSAKRALVVLLSADTRRDARDTRLAARATVPPLRAGRRRTLTVRATVPASAAPGRRRVLVCVSRTRCKASSGLVAVRAAAPKPAPVQPSATSAPVPTPSPIATATPTPTPDAGAGPALAPTPIDPALPTDFQDSVAFLYEGAGRVQTGVAPGTIAAKRVAVLRGTVRDRAGKGMAGVTVTVLDHPELGQTITRADGGYDIAVNGGGPVVLDFARSGHLPAQRRVQAPWQDFAAVEDVVLVALDPNVTVIEAGATGAQTHEGTPQTDADGTRTASIVFPAGLKAHMVLPDGSTRSLERLDVRATEYTVGATGDEAMPGTLPATSAYTYAVELSVDQAIAAGATQVNFDRPVASYTDNFLGFPVGSAVPAGYYDREAGQWKASDNGTVIAITGIEDGRALVDTDGDGAADDGLGIGEGERRQLAAERAVGDELWRVELTHFTPLDYNWPYGPPLDAEYPDPPDPRPDTPADRGTGECSKKGSIIGCQSQSLAEELPLTGTPFKLRFDSRRTARPTDRTVTIPLTGDRIPESLEEVRLEIVVAGQKSVHTFAPRRNLTHELVWDRKDAYGREVQGRIPMYARIGFVYGVRRYADTATQLRAFGRFTSEVFEGSAPVVGRPRSTTARFVAWREYRDEFASAVGSYDTRGTGLGGWELDVHHAYDPRGRTLYRGDGPELSAQPALDRLADTGMAGDARDVDLDAAGNAWVANAATDQVLRFAPDGTATVKAGGTGGEPCEPNCLKNAKQAAGDPPAAGFTLSRPVATALAPDGGFFVADQLADWGLPNHGVVYRVTPEGGIQRYAGCVGCNGLGDGEDARDAAMIPGDIALGADGTVYVADIRWNRIRAVRPDGRIETIAGDGSGTTDGGSARDSEVIDPQAVETGPNGEVYFADLADGGRVRRIEPDGSVRTVAGGNGQPSGELGDGGPATGAVLSDPRGLAVGPDGALYIADATHVRRVNGAGVITTVAGGGGNPVGTGSVPAGSVQFSVANGVALAPDKTMVVASMDGILRLSRPFPETADGTVTVPSKDGTELYRFTAQGRHMATVDGLTQTVRWRFGYDGEGRLTSVTDADDRVTEIQRDAAGDPLAIVAPGGQRTELALNGAGRLRRLGFPGGASATFVYAASGRLTEMTDRRGGVHRYGYDEEGRLVRDENAAGKVQTLARTETATGHTVRVTSHEGRVRTFAVGVDDAGDAFSRYTSASGAETTVRVGVDGVRRASYPDGETVELSHAGDPRWGMYVPVVARAVRKTPGGRTAVTTGIRTVDLADPADPLSARTVTDTFTTNGRAYTVAYDAAARTLTTTTPSGKASRTTYDARGQVAEHAPGSGVAPIAYTYDTRGLLARADQGGLSRTYEYDAQDRPRAVVDAAGRRTEYTYDAAGNVATVKRPGGGVERYEYDAAGDRTAVVLPGGRRQTLDVDGRGLLAGYTPATGAAKLARSHDGDDRLTSEGPAGAVVTHRWEAQGGRATGLGFDGANVHYDYDGAVDRPASIRRVPVGGGAPEAIGSEYDGSLTTKLTAAGTAAGAYTYGYDDDRFLISSELVSGAQTVSVALERDADGQLTKIGPYALTRDGVDGSVSRLAGAGLRLDLERDALARLKARTLNAGGVERYRVALERDASGRITRKTETVAGTQNVYDYAYDPDGRLTRVERDGVVLERYAYDADGNRTSRTLGAGPEEVARYDAQGRLDARGDVDYAFDAAGRLTARGADRFVYSDRGELLSATVGATTVAYRYDGLGRRIARVQGSQTTRYLYGNPGNPVQVTASRAPDGTLTSYTYDEEGLLVALERGGARFFVGTDQLGTPRIVTDTAGTVRKRLERDAFGRLVSDSAPAFELPIGYAGGLDDPVTGLVRVGFRDLDVASGRWTAIDPVLFGGGQANLYEYVGSDPVSLRDPLGLWCVGGSVYEGVGAGAQICSTEEGLSACFEVGFGAGLDFGVGNGKLADDDESIVAEGKASLPGVGVGTGLELNNCGELKPTGQIDAGPFSIKDEGVVEIQPPALAAGLQAKLAAKVCRRIGGK